MPIGTYFAAFHISMIEIEKPTVSDQQRERVRATYDGAQGALLITASALSGNLASAEHLFKSRSFDLRGLRNILDVGSGGGQLTLPLLKYAEATAQVTCSDLSVNMLVRAKSRLRSKEPQFVSCDVEHLPFRCETFDGLTCGFVLEHLPDPHDGIAEMCRVLRRSGRMMLLIMVDGLLSSITARMWHCHIIDPRHLKDACEALGLKLRTLIPLSGWQRVVRGPGLAMVFEKM